MEEEAELQDEETTASFAKQLLVLQQSYCSPALFIGHF